MFYVRKKINTTIKIALVACLSIYLGNYVLQAFLAHRADYIAPTYDRIPITASTDQDTLFLQTGLGESAIEKLIEQDEFDVALNLQDAIFEPTEATCDSLFDWLTREDRRVHDPRIVLVDLQPGDILLTFSTHSVGWRHGHAGLVLDENTVLESVAIGEVSGIMNVDHWTTYSNFIVLRIKGIDETLQRAVAAYAKEKLNGVSYRLLSGWIGEKAPQIDEVMFGAHCSYLIWYAWNQFGYDLDSDGGRLVTCDDIYHSDLVEVVQIYGLELKLDLNK